MSGFPRFVIKILEDALFLISCRKGLVKIVTIDIWNVCQYL